MLHKQVNKGLVLELKPEANNMQQNTILEQ